MKVDNWTLVDTAFLTQSDTYKCLALLMPDSLFKVPVAHVVVPNGVHDML